MIDKKEREELENMFKDNLTERSSWDPHWKDIADNIKPRRGRFNSTDVNKGTKRNDKIINSTATSASRILGAGMHAGITSPARPWFRTAVTDPRISDRGYVKSHLHAVTQAMLTAMAKSNFYNGFATIYSDVGDFGTGALWMDEDPDKIFRCYNLPIGEYVLFTDHRNVVVGIQRVLKLTVRQAIMAFGTRRASTVLKNNWDHANYNQKVEYLHTVQPRRIRDDSKRDNMNMQFESVWIERGSDDFASASESGYHEFPVLAPRWSVNGLDVYGSDNPGMVCLGDVRALQTLERRKGQIIDKIANPPMKAPASMRNQRASLLPGDVNYLDGNAQNAFFEPAIKIDPNAIHVVGEEIMRHEQRIKEAYMADLWLMMAESDRREITAREVDERHEEKMLQLGPVLERLQDELLDPAIARIYGIMSRRGLLPPPPRELVGMDVRVEYLSILMQAQKLLSTGGVERLTTFTMNLGNVRQDVLDMMNFDETVKHYADLLGVKPDLINGDDVVAQIRDARQQAQAHQAQQEQLANEAKATQQLARADTSGQNALTTLMAGAGGGPMGSALAGTMNTPGTVQ